MNKIKAIEMHLQGFSITDISLHCNMSLLAVTILINVYESENCVTLESRINNGFGFGTFSRPVKYNGTVFNTKTEFARFLLDKYGYSKHQTIQRLRRGATPEQCELNEKDYRKEVRGL